MACLGEVSRFGLVERLANGPRCVSDLAREVRLSQSCTTRHLQRLARSGIVRGRRDGKRVLFELCAERPAVRALVGWALSPRGDSKALVRSNVNSARASEAPRPASQPRPARLPSPAPRRAATRSQTAPETRPARAGEEAADRARDDRAVADGPEREPERRPEEHSTPVDLRYQELEDFLL